jgi:choline dehydrogenase-like flavoprotein
MFRERDRVLIPNEGFEIDTDVVVVGSGPGGAVVAEKLSSYGIKVVVLEEGDYVRAEDLPKSRNERPLRAFQKVYRNGGLTVAFSTLPGRPPVPIPLGIGVGGSSLINSGTALRANPETFEKFKNFGVNISYDDIEPFYEEVERFLNVSPVSDEILGVHGRIFLDAAKRLGFSSGPLTRNMRGCKGCGQCQYICPENAKLAMHISYIPEAIRQGAKVIVKSKVSKIIIHNGRAVGVEGEVKIPKEEGGFLKFKFRVFARVVVISAGAIHTPHILKKSGINSPACGKYLTIHPGIRVSALFDFKINQWLGVPQGYFVDEFKKYGIMIEGVAVPPLVGAMTLPFFGKKFKDLIEKYAYVMSTGVMVSDSTFGKVLSLPFYDEPIMIYNLSKKDAENFKLAIYYAAKIFAEAGAKKIFPHIFGVDEITPDEIEKLKDMKVKPSYLEPMAFHPLGTCRMGKSEYFSVVDENCKHHSVENLFISDGSIFPVPLGVNPQLTIMAFSSRTAKFIAEQYFS